ncbi:MAG: VOC family protein [Candidatus Kariarchaeaceae archaeon]|jgi:predicted enzyme related to lactoylglutathione lyase
METEVPVSKLGWFTLCFDVKDMEKAFAFYQTIGFWKIGGGKERGYLTISNGGIRFTLFEEDYIQKEFGVSHLLNFRGGDVEKNFQDLSTKGVEFKQEISIWKDGSIDARFMDLDGNVFYLDTHPTEVGGKTFSQKG